MSDATDLTLRLTIEPEPTAEELVAILTSMQSTAGEPDVDKTNVSRWEETARREHLRHPLTENWNGWNR